MDEEKFVDDFHKLLGRFVVAHARMDFNMGLQLRSIGFYCKVDVSDLLDPLKATFSQRLKKLRQLLLEYYDPAGDAAKDEFKAWYGRADQLRCLRNDYAHGRWAAPGKYNFKGDGSMAEAEPLLAFNPLHWNMDPASPDVSTTLTIE